MSSQPPSSDDPAGIDGEPTTVAPAVGDVHDEVGVDPEVQPWRRQAGRVWHVARWPVFAGAGLFGVLLLAVAWIWITTDLPDISAATDSAVLVDRNGDELAVLAQDGLRIEVDFDEIAPVVADALVAAEDHRFYDHDGVDPLGIGRAVWNNLTDNDTEGGSTITQQLVKNVYLDSDRTLTRKVREAVLAVKVERSSTKEEILERYLNAVYFGRGAYGIEAAARTYFDRAAIELTPEQAALLVGMLRSPERLDPAEAPDAARERRDAVLDAMADLGSLEPAQVGSGQGDPDRGPRRGVIDHAQRWCGSALRRAGAGEDRRRVRRAGAVRPRPGDPHHARPRPTRRPPRRRSPPTSTTPRILRLPWSASTRPVRSEHGSAVGTSTS